MTRRFIAQLVRASHRYREVTGSNPVEVLTFSIRNCFNCVHNCDDHSLLKIDNAVNCMMGCIPSLIEVFLGYGGLLVTPKTLFIFLFSPQVVNLMSVDLLRQQPRWKEALVSLREIMTSLVQQVNTCGYGRFAPVASPCLWLNLH